MNYIVLDLEWNQSRHPRETVTKPLFLSGEIIQIGAVRLNEKFAIKKELRLAVCPKYYTKVHRKVSQITGLNNDDLRRGLPFPRAWEKLKKFFGKDCVILTWGPDDMPMLRDNLILHGIDDSQLPTAYDLQVIFAHQIAHEARQFSLSLAMEMLGEKDFVAHDALNDAHSTALVCRHLNMEEGFAVYPSLANDITARPLEEKELSMRYENKALALRELGDSPFLAPDGEEYLIPEGIIPQNPSKYLAVARGEEKDYLIRFRFLKSRTGSVRVHRELWPLEEDLRIFYEERKKKHAAKPRRPRRKKKTAVPV